MDDFERVLLDRLPLTEATMLLFGHVLEEAAVGQIFQANCGRCYERQLAFSSLVYLVRDALVQHQGSGRASFQRAREAQQLSIANSSVYDKLARVPLAVSRGLLSHAAQKLQGLIPPAATEPLPPTLKDFRVVGLDGKTIKHVTRRLKGLRHLRGKLLGAKLCVAVDLVEGLALAMAASENGEANEIPLASAVVQQVREADPPQARLWVGDRQFCDLKLPGLLGLGPDHYLLRYRRNVGFQPDGSRAAQERLDDRARRVVQEWGWLGAAEHPNRRYVRRITLHRPDDEDVALVTDLLDETRYPALDLLGVYLRRWGIENLFQQVTAVFDLRRLIGSTPKAMIFQAALCFVIYDLIQVVRAHAAVAGDTTVERVSSEQLFADVRRQLTAWAEAAEPQSLLQWLSVPLTPAALRRRLGKLTAAGWTVRWLKVKAQPNRPPRQYPTTKVPGGRISVTRALIEYNQRSQRP